jgi:cobalt-zinc-cadmium efflux system membrane fusion protein
MKHFKYTGLIFAAVVMLLTGCGTKQESQQKEEPGTSARNFIQLTEAQFKTAGIAFGKVEMRSISGTIPASGKLDVPPQSKVTISAPMGGVVKETALLQGTQVKKGQVVAIMQHPDYIQLQQDYKEGYSQLEFVKEEFERQEQLSKENVNAKKSLDKAKADYFSLQAKMEGLRARLQLLNVNIAALEKGSIQNTINLYSPIDGYVTKVHVNIGLYVNPNDVMFEIVNTEHLHAELTIFEKDVPRVKIGQKILFTLANETKHRTATVHLIGKEIGDDRSIQIHCHLDKEDRELIPGMYLKAVVETDSAHVNALPNEAIVGFEGKKYIFISANSTTIGAGQNLQFEMIEVGTGESELGYTEVILPDNFKPDSKVVTAGAYSLLSKMKNGEE